MMKCDAGGCYYVDAAHADSGGASVLLAPSLDFPLALCSSSLSCSIP